MEEEAGAWVPEEEYDALNDETFGDEGEEFNWDDAQNMSTGFEKVKPNGKGEVEQRGMSPLDRGPDLLNSRPLDEGFDTERALEESISRLLIDEFEDDDEDDEMIKMRLKRLGNAKVGSLNTYFLPPQVANRHLQFFFDKELPGASSLLGSSVWSMHPTSAPEPSVPPSVQHYSKPAELPKRQDGIEMKLGHVISSGSKSSSQAGVKKVFKTVEEIEREMMGEPEPVEKPQNNHRPKVLTAEELERELFTGEGSMPSPTRQVPNSHPPGMMVHPQEMGKHSPSMMMPPGSPNRTPPGMVPLHPMMMPPRMMMPPHMMQNVAAAAIAHRMMPPQPGGPRPHPYHQALMNRMRGNFPMPMGGRFPMLPGGVPGGMPPHPMYNRPEFHMQQGIPRAIYEQLRNRDPYCGLMNEKDKQRLRNIAIVQLQNDHPYPTDYYSLMFVVRHGSHDPKRQRDCLLKLFPRKSDESARNNYQPAHFENSLGKLQAVSALAPKKAIDTVIRVLDSGPNRSGLKAYRYMLLEIERLYECLLKMQEADIRKSLLMNADENIIDLRHDCEQKVLNTLKVPQKLSEILSVPKGKLLVSRFMPLIDASFRFYLLSYIVKNFNTWAATKVDTYPYLRHCIFSANITQLASVFNSTVPSEMYQCMIRTKLGSSLVMALIHRAESILEAHLPDQEAESAALYYMQQASPLVQILLDNVQEMEEPVAIPVKIVVHLARWKPSAEEIKKVGFVIAEWERHEVPYFQ